MLKNSYNHFSFKGYLPFYIFCFVLILLSANNVFFWDSVQLAAKHASFFFENGLKLSLLPDKIDSGHIPAFGYLLAVAWKIFGKSLIVSHFFILPFLWGIVFQSNKLLSYFLEDNNKFYLTVFLAGPTLLAQAILVSPDILLVFFLLYMLNGILFQKPLIKIIAISGLSLVSMRGWMVASVLFLFDSINIWLLTKSIKKILKASLVYYPGALIVIGFLLLHYISKGWVGYHEDSPWAGSFEKVNVKGFFWNTGIYAWRLIDCGRIIWWFTLLYMIPYIVKKHKTNHRLIQLIILVILFLFIFPINMLIHKYLMQPRYFMPTYLMVSLLVLYLISSRKMSKFALPIILFFLLAGNLIVYPDKIAQGWDSTLAHLPYYNLRKDAIIFLQNEKIQKKNVKSWFPNLAQEKYISLNNQNSSFSSEELEQTEYCLYSNIFNDIKDHEYDELKYSWQEIYFKQKRGIKIIIYKKQNVPENKKLNN